MAVDLGDSGFSVTPLDPDCESWGRSTALAEIDSVSLEYGGIQGSRILMFHLIEKHALGVPIECRNGMAFLGHLIERNLVPNRTRIELYRDEHRPRLPYKP